MGSSKKHTKGRKSVPPQISAPESALSVRHTFSYGGLLGHDLTASPWIMNVSEQSAAGLDVFMACVKVIADGVAGSDVGQWNGTDRIEPPSTFTLRPDPDMTRHDFLWLFAANLAVYDAVYLEEARLGGELLGVRQHAIPSVLRQGDDYYVVGQRIRNPMKLIRRSLWPTLDIEASATINLAREVLAGAMAANAYTSDFWQQGGAPQWYLSTEQPLTADQADAIQARIVEKRTTSPGQPSVYGQGVKPATLGADLGAAGANAANDKTKASIARYFKMPPGIVNVPSEAGPLTYSTVEQESIHLVRYTMQPYCDVIGEALSGYLPGDYLLGDRIVIDPSRLMMADQFTRFQAWESALRAGWISADEVRQREGLAPGAPEREVVDVPA